MPNLKHWTVGGDTWGAKDMIRLTTTCVEKDELVKDELTIAAGPSGFTVLLHQQGINVNVPGFTEINPQATLKCMDEMTQGQWEWVSTGEIFHHLWQKAWDSTDVGENLVGIPKSIEVLNASDMGLRHMAGMIVLGVEAAMNGNSIFFRNPETYLHPKTERYLAGMLREMLNVCGRSGTITTTKNGESTESIDVEEEEPTEPPSKEEIYEFDRQQTLKWLSCMGPDKAIAELNGKRLTADSMGKEVEDNTDIGKWFIEQYVKLRDGGRK